MIWIPEHIKFFGATRFSDLLENGYSKETIIKDASDVILKLQIEIDSGRLSEDEIPFYEEEIERLETAFLK